MSEEVSSPGPPQQDSAVAVIQEGIEISGDGTVALEEGANQSVSKIHLSY
jgi:hypothetical protein